MLLKAFKTVVTMDIKYQKFSIIKLSSSFAMFQRLINFLIDIIIKTILAERKLVLIFQSFIKICNLPPQPY